MNAQISFLDETLSLIHIPLHLYSTFLQSILQVLLPPSQRKLGDCSSLEDGLEGLDIDAKHAFLNVSVTPIECSIVCNHELAKAVFQPAIDRLPKDVAKTVCFKSEDTYAVLMVISAGMDAGSRVVDLTSPLALAGVPIFFITTYYSDFILVPTQHRKQVVKALSEKGFGFSETDSAFKSPVEMQYARGPSFPGNTGITPPSTPPPSNVEGLQVRAFSTLQKRSVVPYVEPDLVLVQCSGADQNSELELDFSSQRPTASRQQTGNGHHRPPAWVDLVDTKLYTGLVSALVSQPRFLSVTLAENDPPSLLLDRSLLSGFGDSLVGALGAQDGLVPIFLDLRALPTETTGIVSGVAGRLVQEMQMSPETVELSYLSTARAGAVILSSEEAVRALDVLRPLLVKEQ